MRESTKKRKSPPSRRAPLLLSPEGVRHLLMLPGSFHSYTLTGFVLLFTLPALCFAVPSFAQEPKSWNGVDEAVVEKIAREHGREAREPLLDPGSGDLLLFGFLTAGAVGGFAAGYYWRELTGKR